MAGTTVEHIDFNLQNQTLADKQVRLAIVYAIDRQDQSSMNALQLLLADDLPTLPLYFRPNVTAASNRLVNWKPEYNSNGYTWNVWEWDLR